MVIIYHHLCLLSSQEVRDERLLSLLCPKRCSLELSALATDAAGELQEEEEREEREKDMSEMYTCRKWGNDFKK